MQGSGQDQCKWLHEKLTQAGYKVWYDMEEDDLTERGMEEARRQTRVTGHCSAPLAAYSESLRVAGGDGRE